MIDTKISDLSKVALMACDASYVGEKANPLFDYKKPLVPLADTPAYKVPAPYAVSSDWIVAFKRTDRKINPDLFARSVRRGGRGATAQACSQHVAASLAGSQCA